MKADTQISRSGVSYVPTADTRSMEVRGANGQKRILKSNRSSASI
jgi:hypothetical protein